MIEDEAVTIPNDTNPIILKEVLKGQLDSLIKDASGVLDEKVKTLFKSQNLLEKLTEDMKERNRITEKHEDLYRKKQLELEDVGNRWRASKEKWEALRANEETQLMSHRSLMREKEDADTKLSRLEAIAVNFDAIAAVLSSVMELVDDSQPILWTPRKFEWTTIPIFIRDSDTTQLKTNYGRFRITMSRNNNGVLTAKMQPLEPVMRNGYAHPHIASDPDSYTPCLGNAGGMLLQCLNTGDIGTAISVTHDFLTSYNPDSPYIELHNWEDCRYYSPLCECGLVLLSECGCPRCVCGANLEENTASATGCGFCSSCCVREHVKNPEFKRLGIGINNSECLHTGTDYEAELSEQLENNPF